MRIGRIRISRFGFNHVRFSSRTENVDAAIYREWREHRGGAGLDDQLREAFARHLVTRLGDAGMGEVDEFHRRNLRRFEPLTELEEIGADSFLDPADRAEAGHQHTSSRRRSPASPLYLPYLP